MLTKSALAADEGGTNLKASHPTGAEREGKSHCAHRNISACRHQISFGRMLTGLRVLCFLKISSTNAPSSSEDAGVGGRALPASPCRDGVYLDVAGDVAAQVQQKGARAIVG